MALSPLLVAPVQLLLVSHALLINDVDHLVNLIEDFIKGVAGLQQLDDRGDPWRLMLSCCPLEQTLHHSADVVGRLMPGYLQERGCARRGGVRRTEGCKSLIAVENGDGLSDGN